MAGLIGWLYYIWYVLRGLDPKLAAISGAFQGDIFHLFGSIFARSGVGFWIAFVAVLELALQVRVSRHSEPGASLPRDRFPRKRFVGVLIIATTLIIALPIMWGSLAYTSDEQCIYVSTTTGRQLGPSSSCGSNPLFAASCTATFLSGLYFAKLVIPGLKRIIAEMKHPRKTD